MLIRLRRVFGAERLPLGGAAHLRSVGRLAGIEAVGDQRLVGRGAEIVAEVAERAVAQDRAGTALDPRRQLQSAGAVLAARLEPPAAHQCVLELLGALDPEVRVVTIGPVGQQGGDPGRQGSVDRPRSLQHRAERQQVVAQPLERCRPLAAHLEPPDCPGEGAVRIGADLEVVGEAPELDRVVLTQLVATGPGRGRAGGDAAPVALAGWSEGVGAEAEASLPVEAQDADQVVELAEGGANPFGALSLLGQGEVLGLPGGSLHALASHRLDRRVERVGPDHANAAGKLQAGKRHLQADDRRDQQVGLVDVAGLGVELADRPLEAGGVERELGTSLPEVGDEADQHRRGALVGVGGNGRPAGLQVGRGDAGGADRRAGGTERGQRPQLVGALRDESRGQGDVTVEVGALAGVLGDVEGDLVSGRDQRAKPRRRLGGERAQGFA